MKLNKFLGLLVLANMSFAQQNTTAKIKTVAETGLHKMIVPSEIRSFSKEDLSDFRIYDAKGIEVSYLILEEDLSLFSSNFEDFKIVSKTMIPRKNTSIIIENPKKEINEITLYITNSAVTKKYNISGSNNQKEWFGLVNHELLSDLKSHDSTEIAKTISFPLCSYRFLKIDFDDKKTLPINVLKTGQFNNKIKTTVLQNIVPTSIKTTQIQAEKKTLIQTTFDSPQIINQLAFTVTNPSLYIRKARIYLNKTQKFKKKTENYQETIADFESNSDTKNTFTIPQLFEKEFFIEIENQDNQPLTISKIVCKQIPVSVIADLKATENYSIKTGNKKLNTPQYDLSYFKNNLFDNLPIATIYQIEHPNPETKIANNKPIWQQSWFMWLCIAVGGIAILYFTTSLVKDMKNNS